MTTGPRESEYRDVLPTAKHCEEVVSSPWTSGVLPQFHPEILCLPTIPDCFLAQGPTLVLG